MTRSPLRSPDVKGVEGPEYPLNEICAAPGCLRPSEDPHHLFRRSALGGPFDWVQIGPSIATGNVIGLCRVHHDQITTDAAWITWENGAYEWTDLFTPSMLLNHQPPIDRHDENSKEFTRSEPQTNGSQPVSVAPMAAEGSCPTCLRPLPHPKSEHEPKRPRRTWSVTVPKDEREDGAETLDQQLEDARLVMARAGLPYSDAETARFFVLSNVLGLFIAHGEDVMS